MKTFTKAMLMLVASISFFASCAKEPGFSEDTVKHTVRFVAPAEDSATKTSLEIQTIEGVERAVFSWVAEDKANNKLNDENPAKFTVYELNANQEYVKGTTTSAVLVAGVMCIEAEFTGEAPTSPKYRAVFNRGVQQEQESAELSYDQNSDILVSTEAVAIRDDIGNTYAFSFQRMCAISQVKLVGLTAGSTLNEVTVETLDNSALCGNYNVQTGEFTDVKSSIVITSYNDITDGNSMLRFVTLPIDGKKLKFTVSTANASGDVVKTFQKSFINEITLEKGNVRMYNVNFDGVFFIETFSSILGTGGNDGTWSGSIASDKVNNDGSNPTDNEGWVFENEGGANKCVKIGSGSALGKATTPEFSVTGKSVLAFKAAAWNGSSESTTLKISATGATLSDNSVELTKGKWSEYVIYLTNATGRVSITFEGQTTKNSRFFLDNVAIYRGEAPEFVEPVISVTGISLSPSTGTVKIGKTLTLTATITPASASNKNISWVSSNPSVATVNNGVVSGLAAGTAVITATTEDGSFTASSSITVEQAEVTHGNYTITFGNKASTATSITSSVKAATVISAGTDYVLTSPFTVGSGNPYYGDTKTCVRLGSSGKACTLSISLSEAGNVVPESIIVDCVAFGSKNSDCTLSVNDATAIEVPFSSKTNATDALSESDTIQFDYTGSSAIGSLKLASSKSLYIKSIKVVY